jgi:DNA polymerase-3 subunit gamma/tau
VPATILSRCQEFRFRRVPVETLAAHLETLCRAEKITASPSAVRLVARAGEGSVRDAVALLDQLATYGAGTIADEDAARLLGGFDLDLFHRLLAAITKGDADAVASLAAGVEEEGWDPRQLYGRFLGYCRDALHLSLGRETATPAAAASARLDLPADEVVRLQAVAKEAGYENLLRLLHQLIAAEQLVRRSEVPGLALEVALLRAAELPKLTRVEELLRGGAAPTVGSRPAASPVEGGAPAAEHGHRGGTSPRRRRGPGSTRTTRLSEAAVTFRAAARDRGDRSRSRRQQRADRPPCSTPWPAGARCSPPTSVRRRRCTRGQRAPHLPPARRQQPRRGAAAAGQRTRSRRRWSKSAAAARVGASSTATRAARPPPPPRRRRLRSLPPPPTRRCRRCSTSSAARSRRSSAPAQRSSR